MEETRVPAALMRTELMGVIDGEEVNRVYPGAQPVKSSGVALPRTTVDNGIIRKLILDITIGAATGLFLILMLIVPPVHGDEPLAVPAKHSVLSPNKKFRAELDPRAGTKIINAQSGRVLWQLPDWYRWAFLANDGDHFVTGYHGINLIPIDYPKGLVLLTFWNRGHKIGEITVVDIFTDTRLLQRTVSHYNWGYISGIERDWFLHVKRSDGLEIYFDVRTAARIERIGKSQNVGGLAGDTLGGGSGMEHGTQRYEGFIVIQPGLESRVFKKDLEQREFCWVDYGTDVSTVEINKKMVTLNEVTLAVWVQVEGEMQQGHFGHSNQYEKRLLIRKVISCSSSLVEKYRALHK